LDRCALMVRSSVSETPEIGANIALIENISALANVQASNADSQPPSNSAHQHSNEDKAYQQLDKVTAGRI
jgi:DNA-directed RNA polymerase beta subunit